MRAQRRQMALEARQRWLAAIDAGLPHYEVLVRWESYTRLAGNDLAQLENEASHGQG